MALIERVPSRSGPALAAPLAVLAAAGGALAMLASRSPEQPGHYPVCPFHYVTGLWCPGCGSLRALHALTRGDPATAVHRNVLALAALPVLAFAWLHWFRRAATGRPRGPGTLPAYVLWGLMAVIIAFGVTRNLPVGAWLAPGT